MTLWTESYELSKQQRAKEAAKQLGGSYQEASLMYQQGTHAVSASHESSGPSGQFDRQGGGASSSHAATAIDSQLLHLHQWQQRLELYNMLRKKCDVPHPSWVLVNQLLQVSSVTGRLL